MASEDDADIALRGQTPSLSRPDFKPVPGSGAAHVRIVRRMEVFAFFCELGNQRTQFRETSFRGPDRQALLTFRVPARLTGVQPVLHGTGEQSVGDIPEIGLLILVGDAIAEVHGFAKGLVENTVGLLHDGASVSREGTQFTRPAESGPDGDDHARVARHELSSDRCTLPVESCGLDGCSNVGSPVPSTQASRY